MSEVIVIDSMPGQGKTSYILQMINDDIKSGFGELRARMIYNYIFVTPYLSEVDRIKKSTYNILIDPQNKKVSKRQDFLKLIEFGESIVMSHKLFNDLTRQDYDLMRKNNYILIIDESPQIIEEISLSSEDIKLLIDSNYIEIGDKNLVTWKNQSYSFNNKNRFNDIHNKIINECIYTNNESTKLYKLFDVDIFSKFEKVYILTYLFDGQFIKYLFDFQNINYLKKSVIYENDIYKLIEYDKNIENRDGVKKLLNVYEDIKSPIGRHSNLNNNFNYRKKDIDRLLNKSWFDEATDEELQALHNNLINYFRKKVETRNDLLFWTTLKDKAEILSGPKCKYDKKRTEVKKNNVVKEKQNSTDKDGKKFKDNFLGLGTRATNDYAECTAMAFVYNRFPNPNQNNFFKQHTIKTNDEVYAVSELIQFIFRGCIRNGKPMNCYIPSHRMRNLLYDWMNFRL